MRLRICVRLLGNDAEKFAHLGRVEPALCLHQRDRRTLDRRERRAQFVAHQPQELRAHPLDFVEWREILHGDHHRFRHRTPQPRSA